MPEKKPLFNKVVDIAIANFWSKDSYYSPYMDRQEPYLITVAAKDAIRAIEDETGIKPFALALRMIRSTVFKPKDLNLESLADTESWNKFALEVTNSIIAAEAERKDLGIIPEDYRRLDDLG